MEVTIGRAIYLSISADDLFEHQIYFQYVYRIFTEEAQEFMAGAFVDDGLYIGFAHVVFTGEARYLVLGSCYGDIRVEAAAGVGNEIYRDGLSPCSGLAFLIFSTPSATSFS